MPKFYVFFISDSTGITSENIGKSLLAQFNNIEFEYIYLSFINNLEKTLKAVNKINDIAKTTRARPIVFSTQAHEEYNTLIQHSDGIIFDVFDTYINQLETIFSQPSLHRMGVSHSLNHNQESYATRLRSIDFTLNNDDGISTKEFHNADIILIGVSRCGKTPTCLYLAMQYGIRAANYPLLEEDLETQELPNALKEHTQKLFGLTIHPTRLQHIRNERKQHSTYANLAQCQKELRNAEHLFTHNAINYIDVSNISIEEIAVKIISKNKLNRRY